MVSVPHDEALIPHHLSLACWVYHTDSEGPIISKMPSADKADGDGDPEFGYELGISKVKGEGYKVLLRLGLWEEPPERPKDYSLELLSNRTTPLGVWYHVAASWDGDSRKLQENATDEQRRKNEWVVAETKRLDAETCRLTLMNDILERSDAEAAEIYRTLNDPTLNEFLKTVIRSIGERDGRVRD